jgi:predicted O-methyltransferase YrrM
MISARLKYALSFDAWNNLLRRTAHRAVLRFRQATGAIPQAPLGGAEGLPKEIRSLMCDLSTRECKPLSILSEPSSFGGEYQRNRIRTVAEYCLSVYPGDIIEIGCYIGETTRILAEVAQKNGRRVIAVDPWATGTQNCSGVEYDQFQENIKQYADCVDVIRLSSLSLEAIQHMKQRSLSMVFVDGLHTYEAALSDIRAVSHCAGIIAVDDVSYSFDVMLAMRQAAHELGRKAVHLSPAKEGYLLP